MNFVPLALYVAALKSSMAMYSPDGMFVPGAVETSDAVLKVFDPAVANAAIDLKKTYDDRFVKRANAGK